MELDIQLHFTSLHHTDFAGGSIRSGFLTSGLVEWSADYLVHCFLLPLRVQLPAHIRQGSSPLFYNIPHLRLQVMSLVYAFVMLAVLVATSSQIVLES